MIHCSFNASATMTNSTAVQNIFIIEYMPKAPEEFVKVYLYGLMQCSNRAMEGTDLAFALGMAEGRVLEAFLYWQDKGLLRIASESPLCVEYSGALTGSVRMGGERKYARLVEALRTVAGERMFTPQELAKIYDWIEIFGMEEAAALMLVKYCMQRKGAKVRIQYMDKAARSWAEDGVLTAEDAERRIRNETEIQGGARDILNRWRKTRMATEDELALYRRWTREWGMSHEDILAACPAVTASDKPTFAYLNGVLEGMRSGGGVQQYLRDTALVEELSRQAFIRAGIQRTATRRDKELMTQWVRGWHMDVETVLLAADYSAGSSKPFDNMRRLLEGWHEKGITAMSQARNEHQKQLEQKQEREAKHTGRKEKNFHFMSYEQRGYDEDELKEMGLPMPEEYDE